MESNLFYEIALAAVPNVGSVTFRNLINYAQSARAVFDLPLTKLLKIPKIGEKVAQIITQKSTFEYAQEQIRKAQSQNVEIISLCSPQYPTRLRNTNKAPVLLYFKGQIPQSNKNLAIVGTRKATAYGKAFTENFIKDLVHYQPNIISGLAYGIDIAAHRQSLQVGLPTFGVMATGVDIIYPSEHQNTVSKMLQQQGGIVTEYAFGTQPDAMRFPERNRIIAGLADAVLVVEAAAKGGALITAEYANTYNREVFAVPNSVDAKYSQGCHQLIRKHKAQLITNAQELVEILGWDKEKNEIAIPYLDKLDEPQRKIISVLQEKKQMQIDHLAWECQMSVAQVSVIALDLELNGYLKTLAGKKLALAQNFST